MRQGFNCAECDAEGYIDLPHGLDTDALVVLTLLDKAHRKQSPECRLTNKAEILKEMIVRGEWPHSLEAGVLN